jgi:hypothetical protein
MLLAEMCHIVTLRTQPFYDADRHAHVREESHPGTRSGDANFLLGEPGCVFKRLLDILWF